MPSDSRIYIPLRKGEFHCQREMGARGGKIVKWVNMEMLPPRLSRENTPLAKQVAREGKRIRKKRSSFEVG